MGINAAGLAAGYQGYRQAKRQEDEDALRAKAAERADKDAAFQEEARQRQRTEWSEADRSRAADREDVRVANEKYDQPPTPAEQEATAAAVTKAFETPDAMLSAAASTPAKDSVVTAAPTWADAPVKAAPTFSIEQKPITMGQGMPKSNNFNNTLDKMAMRLSRKSERGDMTPEAYAAGTGFITQIRKQGIADALELMSQGRYDEAMGKYNSTGNLNGARIIEGKEGTTKINGEDTPTHFVTIANADGTRTTMDVAKARYQLLDMNTQLNHQDNARRTTTQAAQHAETIKLQREQMVQSGNDAAAGRALQAKALKIQVDQYQAATPLGQLTAMSAALGRPLTTAEIENRLQVSRIPRAVEMQVQSLMKEGETEANAMAKAVASPEGINPTAASTFQKNAAIRSAKLSQLLTPYAGSAAASSAAADPLGLNTQPGGVTVPNPMEQGAPVALSDVGGVRAARAAKLAESDKRMSTFNAAVGGANTSRAGIQEQRQNDVKQNFDGNLSAIKRGMSRAEQQRVLSWMSTMADTGALTNDQIRQVRQARQAAGL